MMTTTFRIDASELNGSFLQKLQMLFEDKKLVITIEEEMDETGYLLSNEETRKSLQRSMEQLHNGELIPVSLEGLERNLIG